MIDWSKVVILKQIIFFQRNFKNQPKGVISKEREDKIKTWNRPYVSH